MIRKHWLALLAFMVASTAAARAASGDSLRIAPKTPGQEEIMTALKALDIEMYSFDLNGLNSADRKISVYVDEYVKGNEKPNRVYSTNCGHTWQYMRDIPEDIQAEVRKEYGLDADDDYFSRFSSLTTVFHRLNDSTTVLMMDLPGVLTVRPRLKLYPISPYNRYFYRSLPFRLDAMPPSGNYSIPLVLYGSGWYDERINVLRFCGENEIDPNLKAEIIGNLPRYYVIGIEVKEE